jgi:peptidoglycan/xylan/chitin deacetylase (PgdA/CDA1 family)
VSLQNFAEHLEILRRYGCPLALKNLSQKRSGQTHGRRRIVVTFDDGYADNLVHAKPLLERNDVPASVFVATGLLGSKGGFWKDYLTQIFLAAGSLPATLNLRIHDDRIHCDLGHAALYSEKESARHAGWNVSEQHDPTARHRLYRSLCERLAPLTDDERQAILQRLQEWAGTESDHDFPHRTLTDDDVVELAQGGLVEIGAHTVTHPMLSALSVVAQRQEIERSKIYLQHLLGKDVTSFAYPYGGMAHYTEATVAAVRDAGFELACSNFAGLVRKDTDPWQLPRFLVRDWPGEEFAYQLREWLCY